jgi:tetratricopeptide (TPR) repeat protein
MKDGYGARFCTALHIVAAVILCFSFSSAARKSIVVFPLRNGTGEIQHEWMRYGVAHRWYSAFTTDKTVKVWNPLFIFSVDSTGWQCHSDSLMSVHQKRWKWDIAVGGVFYRQESTVLCSLTVVLKERTGMRKEAVAVNEVSMEACVESLFNWFVKTAGIDSGRGEDFSRGIKTEAYRVFLAGYGYEIHRAFNNAVSSYLFAVELDPSFGLAWSFCGDIYRRNRDIENAQKCFDRAVNVAPENPMVIAVAGNYIVRWESRETIRKFIEKNKQILTATACGMTATGIGYLTLGEYQRSIAILTRAVAFGPGDLEADFALGRAYMEAGDYALAADIFNRLIAFHPDNLSYYSFLSAAYRRAGKLMEASGVLERAYALDSENSSILINLSHTYFLLSWYSKAEQLLLHAQKLNPQLDEIKVNLGIVYWHMGKHEKAHALFEEAAESPKHVQSAYANQANILFLSGEVRRAISLYKKANKLGEKDETVLYNLGQAYYSREKYKDAAACFDELLQMSPGRKDILVQRAIITDELGNDSEAELLYHKILDQYPHTEEILFRLIALLEKNEQYEAAIEHIENYLKEYPRHRKLQYLLADIYRMMEWYEVAIMNFKKYITDFPENPSGYAGLGQTYFESVQAGKSDDYETAIYHLKDASKKNPHDPMPDYMIGLLYLDYLHYADLAVDHFSEAIKRATVAEQRKKIEKALARARS